jgi:RimJ/RimL family protein N-acetyltransferase
MGNAGLLDIMKQNNLESAEIFTLPINGNVSLVPIGRWIFLHDDFIQLMASWRFQSKNSFFARFPLSAESFTSYLMKHSILDPNTLMFAILDDKSRLIGHVGLSKVTSDSASIDAVMIRPESRSSGLGKLVLSVLIEWADSVLKIDSLELEVLSSNYGAISLYEKLGFKVVSRFSLRRIVEGDREFLLDCEQSETNVEEMKLLMSLSVPEIAGS